MRSGATELPARGAAAAGHRSRTDRRPERRWQLVALAIAVPVLLPLLVSAGSLLHPDDAVWQHLAAYRLPDVLANTLWLVLGVAAGAALLGTSLGWLTAACEFPGRRLFSWALLLPMAMPGYVLAFVAVGLLEYTGPIQQLLREQFGTSAWFPPVRSRGGVIAVMTLSLYPYVYLLARTAFLTQGRRALEVARSLGMGPWRGFLRAALPLARPWIAAGTLLVAMETMADFGAVSVFNYDTLTIAIYEAWFQLFSLDSALQLASALMLFALVLVGLEQHLRRRTRYTSVEPGAGSAGRLKLRGWRAALASGYAALVLALGFVLPALELCAWTFVHRADLNLRTLWLAGHSVVLAVAAVVLIVTVALLLGYAVRLSPRRATRFAARLATLGYALPGTVLAVSLFVPIAALNNGLQALLDELFGESAPQLLLQGTVLVLLLAYLVRFLAVAHGPLAASLTRIRPSLDEAARGLGVAGLAMLRRVHLPMLRQGLLAASILVFVDVMKEMPITLMTRPFGWDTLAVRVFEMTAEGHWERAAMPAIAIVLTGLVPVALLLRRSDAP